MDKYIELGKKLKALADQGIGGEKNNAEKMLSDLMKKHKLTIEDIQGEQMHDYFFNINPQQINMWAQIVSKVNTKIKRYGEFPKAEIKKSGLKGNYLITCTPCEYIEIESMFSFYYSLWIKELETFHYAFCKANNLLVAPPNRIFVDDLSPEEKENYRRASKMAQNIKSEVFVKQLEK